MKINVNVLTNEGYFDGKVSRGRQCAYCEKPAKIYVWCQKHLGEMIRIKVNLNKEVNKDD